MTGADRVAKAPPDGYQFVLGNVGTHAQNQTLYKNPLLQRGDRLRAGRLLVDQPMLLVARKDFPAGNLPEFIAYAKANQARCSTARPARAPDPSRLRAAQCRRSASTSRTCRIAAAGRRCRT